MLANAYFNAGNLTSAAVALDRLATEAHVGDLAVKRSRSSTRVVER
jgi:hypothetical protein